MMKKKETLLVLSIVLGLMGTCTACGDKEKATTQSEESSAAVIALEEENNVDVTEIITELTQDQLYYRVSEHIGSVAAAFRFCKHPEWCKFRHNHTGNLCI